MKRFKLIELRKNKKLTQKDIASFANIDRGYYAHIELGTKTPSLAVAIKIAELLSTDINIFFDSECVREKAS